MDGSATAAKASGLGAALSRPAVLVTGASTGIGRATALHLARLGFEVLAGVRREEDAAELRRSSDLRPLLLDVTRRESVESAAATVESLVGEQGLCGLVNNAGVSINGPVEFVPLERWREQFEVNVFGVVAVTQAMLPLLRARVRFAGRMSARIVMMSSVAGRVAQPLAGPYTASKFALESLSDALRMELRRQGIGVCVIQPGAIDTPFWKKGCAVNGRAREMYGLELDRVQAAMEKTAAAAIAPEKVAAAVGHCLTHRRPRATYPVGTDAVMGVLSKRFLPASWFDRAVRNFYKLP